MSAVTTAPARFDVQRLINQAVAQGHGEKVTDAATLRRIAALVREAP